MIETIRALAKQFYPDVIRLRRLIHSNPELAFEEVETAQLVCETLARLDIPFETGVAKTGVVATLRGAAPGPTLLLRADMDALPITEATGLKYASRNPGKMHACGHDAHTSSLLGTAMILHQIRDQLPGTIRFVYQPSEERLPGGAKAMIEAGILNTPAPKATFAQHVRPTLPAGTIGVRRGMFMASAEEIYITVKGGGGHAAEPHKLPNDVVLATAHIIVALQAVVSRHAAPDVPTVLSFGRVNADGATNVIPDQVRVEGTFRTMDESWRFRAHDLIRRVATHTALAHGAVAEMDIRLGYPALVNDPESAALCREAAIEYVGPDNTVDLDPWFASEDFAYFLRNVPGALYLLGVGDDTEQRALHTPRFTVNEKSLETGPGFMAYLAWKYLHRHAAAYS